MYSNEGSFSTPMAEPITGPSTEMMTIKNKGPILLKRISGYLQRLVHNMAYPLD